MDITWKGPGDRPNLKRDKLPPVNGGVPRIRYSTQLSAIATAYHVTQAFIAVALSFITLAYPLPAKYVYGGSFCALLSYIAQGIALDGRSYAYMFEVGRLLATFPAVFIATHDPSKVLPSWWEDVGHVYIALLVISFVAILAVPSVITGAEAKTAKSAKLQ